MQATKLKVRDMVSTAKEKVKEHKAKTEEKSGVKSAHSRNEEEMAHEKCRAKICSAKAQLHDEKAQHRAQAQAQAHTHIPGWGMRTASHIQVYGTAGTAVSVPSKPTSSSSYLDGGKHEDRKYL